MSNNEIGNSAVYDARELGKGKMFLLGFQHMFAMFGATVLVPVLFHINPATVLLFNGIGTLLYLFICKGKIPAYLGSSFAFISPVLLLLPLGYEVALGGFIMCGVLFCLVSFIVKKAGCLLYTSPSPRD